jgi:hypothetical protein
MLSPALVLVDDDHPIRIALGNGFIGAYQSTDWFAAMIAWNRQMTDENMGIPAFFTMSNSYPLRWPGRYVVPVLASYRTRKATGASGLIEVKT